MALLRFAQRRRIVGGEMPGPPHAVAMSRLKETLNTMLADFGAELLAVIPPVPPAAAGLARVQGQFARNRGRRSRSLESASKLRTMASSDGYAQGLLFGLRVDARVADRLNPS